MDEHDLKEAVDGLHRIDAFAVTGIDTSLKIATTAISTLMVRVLVGQTSNTQPTASTAIDINKRYWKR